MWKLLATILVVVAVAAAAARAETADYGPCIIGRDSPCNERQWRRKAGGWNNLNNDPPAAPSPDQLTPTLDSAEYVHDFPEIGPPSYVGL